ncbi:hypothetical protein DRW48_10825 [Paracoccus suum]|uniref:Uncharacterized protein n=1 Tax=Paracoccus suum TaxID=2259340 RepID=A0A344PL69_9RHOB|nr:hypothetical protein [Paracoccus suum]AXC50124.1 hypothetical protein DRW48_10825 [Paracoccus suum]
MSEELLRPPEGVSAGSREAWTLFTTAPLPEGWRRELRSNGFIQHDLRFYHGEDWMFSAILNEGWVLFSLRKPAIRGGITTPDALLARFPAARWKDKGEVKLRLHDEAEAQALWDWLKVGA